MKGDEKFQRMRVSSEDYCTNIVGVDLRNRRMTEPLNAYRITEGSFGIATYSSTFPFMITCGLSACKAVGLYDETSQEGLLAHIQNLKDPNITIQKLAGQIHTNIRSNIAYVIFGDHQSPFHKNGEGLYWPEIDELINALKALHPKTILVERHMGIPARGIAINLKDGSLFDLIRQSNGWSLSSQQNLSINRKVESIL